MFSKYWAAFFDAVNARFSEAMAITTDESIMIPFLSAGDLHRSISIAGNNGNKIKNAIEDIVITDLLDFTKKLPFILAIFCILDYKKKQGTYFKV